MSVPGNLALIITLTYAFMGSLWIIGSDHLLAAIAPTVSLLTELQTLKGWFFIFCTSLMLYAFIQLSLRQLLRTYRKQAEEALRLSEARYRSLVTATAQAVWTTDAAGWVTEDISSWRTLVGYTYEETRGWGWLNAVHPDERAFVAALWTQAVESGSFYETEMQMRVASGEYRHFLVRGVPVLREDGTIREWIGTHADITEQKAAEGSLQRFNQELERVVLERTQSLLEAQDDLKQQEQDVRRALEKERELGELKTSFVSNVSHEFRTPLTVITTSAKLLEQFYDQASPQQRETYFSRIHQASQSLVQLLDDLLLIGQAESNCLECCPTAFSLSTFCEGLMDAVRLAHSDRLLKLDYSGLTTANLDEKLLHYILTNLLSNALKYSPQDKPVSLTVFCGERAVMFQVTDEGIGIILEDQERLFESFHRGRNVGKIPGTGLGLSIVKQCVDLHQGIIEVSSTLEEGTNFTVMLPMNL